MSLPVSQKSFQYYAGHEFFLDGAHAVFVIVVRLDKVEDKTEDGEKQLLYWLRFIKNRLAEKPADSSTRPSVILLGSSRDMVKTSAIARQENGRWRSDWGERQLAKVLLLFLGIVS